MTKIKDKPKSTVLPALKTRNISKMSVQTLSKYNASTLRRARNRLNLDDVAVFEKLTAAARIATRRAYEHHTAGKTRMRLPGLTVTNISGMSVDILSKYSDTSLYQVKKQLIANGLDVPFQLNTALKIVLKRYRDNHKKLRADTPSDPNSSRVVVRTFPDNGFYIVEFDGETIFDEFTDVPVIESYLDNRILAVAGSGVDGWTVFESDGSMKYGEIKTISLHGNKTCLRLTLKNSSNAFLMAHHLSTDSMTRQFRIER